MHTSLAAVCAALDALAAATIKAWADERTLTEAFGWHHPAMTRHDLAYLPRRLADQIREASPQTVDSSLQKELEVVPKRLQQVQTTTLPQVFAGNGHQAIPAFLATIEWVAQLVGPVVGWQTLTDNKAMPAALARRLRSMQAELADIAPNKEALSEQIRLIQDATEAAESLPTDLQALREARDKIERFAKESSDLCSKTAARAEESAGSAEKAELHQKEAEKLVQQCDEAYRITTTKGLAAAFDQRAGRLATSVWVWVLGLLAALWVGADMGSRRIESLSVALAAPDPHWGVIWMHIVLSVLSIGAPIWFAWLATKQIGQRFRLSEDYAFKASVAKAYEGYRREAARIDEAFEARLFGSALTRLEEAPLRLVESDAHGSPWHELVNSEAFQSALGLAPELKAKFMQLVTDVPQSKPAHGTGPKAVATGTLGE